MIQKFKDKNVTQQVTVFRELNSGMILGMDFITDHKLTFLPTRREFRWVDPDTWYQGRCLVVQKTKIPPLTVAPVRVQMKTLGPSRWPWDKWDTLRTPT